MDIEYLWYLASKARTDIQLAKNRGVGTRAEFYLRRAAEEVESLYEALGECKDSWMCVEVGSKPAEEDQELVEEITEGADTPKIN